MNKILYFLILFVVSVVFLLFVVLFMNVYVQVLLIDSGMVSELNQLVIDMWIMIKVKGEFVIIDGVKSIDISVKMVDGVVMFMGVLLMKVVVKKVIVVMCVIKGVKYVDVFGLKVKV